MTRMWMTDPKIMCRNHLLGEHKEIHQLLGSLKKGYSVKGYVDNNCIEITSIVSRHDRIVEEMLSRGYNHMSPIHFTQSEINSYSVALYPPEHINYKVDADLSLQDLLKRCSKCNSNKEYLNERNKIQ